MRFDLLCITLFNWEKGIMLGGDTKNFTVLKLEVPRLEIAGVTVLAFKLIEIAV